ncbi:hypothetical protein BUE80_DR003101 [Diplocarpon rosae]|nr:hypothetical protein BUE80_DR003101 [Diplocarpon rosae]
MTHQAKRQYAGARSSSQATITSYFTPGALPSSSTYSLPPHNLSTSTSNTPQLPHAVQSNLLNVGMRVRKSVPEGYKTGSKYGAYTLFSDSRSPPPMPSNSHAPTSKRLSNTRPRAGNRELTPFCGIMKVGGMAGQQWDSYSNAAGEGEESARTEDEEDDDVPFLSSQGSTISNVSTEAYTSGGSKRRFLEDEELDTGTEMGGVNGSSALSERVLAVPRRKKWSEKTQGQVRIFGQENFTPGDDFEDADFLDYSLSEEVEMSGV